MQAARQLAEQGIFVRVVSMPSTNRFDKQDAEYRESVLPSSCSRRVAVEAGTRDFWYKYVGLNGAVIGMDGFGASAPAEHLYAHFGITSAAVADAVKKLH
jgi:transketolase